jgi:hypothetical protein
LSSIGAAPRSGQIAINALPLVTGCFREAGWNPASGHLQCPHTTETKMKLHPKLTVEIILEAAWRLENSLDNPGFCNECGAEVEAVEPDARKYKCGACGTNAVYGAEELLLEVAP